MRGLGLWVFLLALPGLSLAQGVPAWELRVCADPNRLPFSNQQKQGLDNRIIELIAKEMGARLSYVWWPQSPSMINNQLRQGTCDVVLGVGESYQNVLSTLAYYQSSFVFVYRENSPYKIASLDDPELKNLRIAIETAGVPPFESLANRGLSAKAAIIDAVDLKNPSAASPLVEAVAKGQVDVGILWGPVAGYFAKKQAVKLAITPISPEFEPPALSMVYAITLGVRAGDEALRDRLNVAIARRWDQIQAILREYAIPQIPLPKPVLEVK